MLGSSTWRIESIDTQRVIVGRAEGHSAMAPFWRGEASDRTAELGEAVGALCRELAARKDEPGVLNWLQAEYHLEPRAAQALRDHVARQARVAGCVPDDRTVLVESYTDPAGETGLAILTPFGGKLHQALKLAIQARLKERLGVEAAALHGNDGLLFRLPQMDETPLDILDGLSAELAESLVRERLGDSALFGLRFRQNAGRALLMPRPDPSKRTPLWLQRLRAKDLLQVVRKFGDFPVVVETYRECLGDDLDLPRLRSFLDAIESGAIRVVGRRGEVPSPFVADLIFRFQQQYLYEWDEPKRSETNGRAAIVDDDLLDPLLATRWLDPAAVGRVESRIRGVGKPPRTAEEMAETLRRLGDLTETELAGPMLGFLTQLQTEGRAESIRLEGTAEPARWICAEERELYRAAFQYGDGDETPETLDTIARRYLQTHALVGLDDLLARYPVDAATATDLLERWSEEGRAIRLDPIDGEADPRWADPKNLAEVRRLSIALRRRESVAVAPEVFADFLLRRHHLHPDTRCEGSAAVGEVLERLAGFAAPADLWESEILPARVRDYRPAWLDDALASGRWLWRAEADGQGEPRVAFLARVFPFDARTIADAPSLSELGERVLAALTRLGASFTADLARMTGLEPSRIHQALDELLRRGLVTNDRFDPLRRGGNTMAKALADASTRSLARRPRLGMSRHGPSPRRSESTRPEGRWSVLTDIRMEKTREHGRTRLQPSGEIATHLAEASSSPSGFDPDSTAPVMEGLEVADRESAVAVWAAVLLDRYGVLTRETAALDPWAPDWRDLAACLARAELRGDVRRGYFVEGLTGMQFAAEDVVETLARKGNDRGSQAPLVLISTLDPANLYGAGAPLDIDLLEGGTARLPRSSANHLVLCGGRPVLIIEANGKRLTGLASASENELREAVGLVPRLARPSRHVLKVETYNTAAALASPAAPWLAAAGFVRDHPGMAYFATW